MSLDPSRLRHGEWIAAASAVLLLVFMVFVPWYGVSHAPPAAAVGRSSSYTGWSALAHLRWLILVTIVAALALAFLQASRRAPAWPATMSVIVTVLALITALAVLYRVVISVPGADDLLEQKAGSFLGLACALGILYGACASMRQEGIAERDAPQEIETVSLTGAGGT
jgi:hypothetical protein